MKTCRVCLEQKGDENFNNVPWGDGLHSMCKSCLSKKNKEKYQNDKRYREKLIEYVKNYRKDRNKIGVAQSLWKRKNIQKIKAQNAIDWEIRSGRIKRLPCEKCGDPKSEAHHDDYSKPLEVRWLCFRHHRIEHGQYQYELKHRRAEDRKRESDNGKE